MKVLLALGLLLAVLVVLVWRQRHPARFAGVDRAEDPDPIDDRDYLAMALRLNLLSIVLAIASVAALFFVMSLRPGHGYPGGPYISWLPWVVSVIGFLVAALAIRAAGRIAALSWTALFLNAAPWILAAGFWWLFHGM